MKPTIFNERVAKALRTWHQTARRQIKKNRHLGSETAMSSRPSTPFHGSSPARLLHYYKSALDSVNASPNVSNYKTEPWQAEEDFSLSELAHHRGTQEEIEEEMDTQEHPNHLSSPPHHFLHDINAADSSFENNSGVEYLQGKHNISI